MSTPESPRSPAYELFILGLSLYVVAAFTVEAVAQLDPETAAVLLYADTAICVVFLADFVRNVVRAPDRLRYLVSWGWIDLLSSIPFLGPARLGRAARIFRILRVLRGFRSVRNLIAFVLQRRGQSLFAAVSFVSLMLVVFSAVAILQFEPRAEGSNIRTAQDALWWSYVTITTVGYGDHFPVTIEGRVIGAVLMTAGVGLFGTFTAFLASWLVNGRPQPQPVQAPAAAHAVDVEVNRGA